MASGEFAGKYHEIKGRIKQRFGEVTNDDLEQAGGSIEELVGVIQEKTGEARQTIESYLRNLFDEGDRAAHRFRSQMEGFANEAGQRAREGYEQIAGNVRQGYSQTQEAVRRNPIESVAVALGAGVLVGAILGLLASRPR